jgi:anti-anti-sigma factor
VVTLSGVFTGKDGYTWVREDLQNLLAAGEKAIVVHLGRVERIDSGGLGTLAEASLAAKKYGSEIKLAAPTEQIIKSLEVTHLLSLFEIHPDTEEAVKSFE